MHVHQQHERESRVAHEHQLQLANTITQASIAQQEPLLDCYAVDQV